MTVAYSVFDAALFDLPVLRARHASGASPMSSAAQRLPCSCSSAPAGKSAQLPLYVWLPDAMEGPTAGLAP